MENTILNIAVIGDEDLVNGLRLVGVSRYYMISQKDQFRDEEVRTAFSTLIQDNKIGIIAVQETYMEYIRDLVEKSSDSKNLIPVVVEVPSRHAACTEDKTNYYKNYVAKFTGFEIDI